jgi:hypothetical protein
MFSAGFSTSKTLNGQKREETREFRGQKLITEQEYKKTMAAVLLFLSFF